LSLTGAERRPHRIGKLPATEPRPDVGEGAAKAVKAGALLEGQLVGDASPNAEVLEVSGPRTIKGRQGLPVPVLGEQRPDEATVHVAPLREGGR